MAFVGYKSLPELSLSASVEVRNELITTPWSKSGLLALGWNTWVDQCSSPGFVVSILNLWFRGQGLVPSTADLIGLKGLTKRVKYSEQILGPSSVSLYFNRHIMGTESPQIMTRAIAKSQSNPKLLSVNLNSKSQLQVQASCSSKDSSLYWQCYPPISIKLPERSTRTNGGIRLLNLGWVCPNENGSFHSSKLFMCQCKRPLPEKTGPKPGPIT